MKLSFRSVARKLSSRAPLIANFRKVAVVALSAFFIAAPAWSAEQSGAATSLSATQVMSPDQSGSQAAPEVVTLQDALARARANNPEFLAATKTEVGIAREDRVQARAGLLPSVNYNNQYLYTQGGTGIDVPRFIANNAVHEYVSQGNAHEEFGGAQIAAFRRATAAIALAQARAEVATRGLVVTVVQTYYG